MSDEDEYEDVTVSIRFSPLILSLVSVPSFVRRWICSIPSLPS